MSSLKNYLLLIITIFFIKHDYVYVRAGRIISRVADNMVLRPTGTLHLVSGGRTNYAYAADNHNNTNIITPTSERFSVNGGSIVETETREGSPANGDNTNIITPESERSSATVMQNVDDGFTYCKSQLVKDEFEDGLFNYKMLLKKFTYSSKAHFFENLLKSENMDVLLNSCKTILDNRISVEYCEYLMNFLYNIKMENASTFCRRKAMPPDIITDESSPDLTLMEGENATLSCHATGNPEPKITWRRENGQPLMLRTGSRDLVKHNSYTGNDLKLWRLDRRQTGVYFCIASNGIPPAVSKRITLSVYFPPVIAVPNQLLGAPIGTDVTLECHVESYPKSINYWVRNRTKMLMDGPKHILRETISGYKAAYYIVIKTFDQSDVGTYNCISTNSIGNSEGTLRVYELQGDIPIGKSSKNKVARSSACPKHMHIVTVAALTAIWARAIG